MDELARQLEQAGAHVRIDWDEAHARAVRAAMATRARQRRQARIAGALVASIAVATTAGLTLWRTRGAPSAASRTATPARPVRVGLQLADGSRATPADPDCQLELVEDSPTRTVVRLAHGRARFDVRHAPTRVFRVEAGAVVVQVLGTSFTVDRGRDETRAEVSVTQGRVRVFFAGHIADLGAGEHDSFPRAWRAGDPTELLGPTAEARVDEGAPSEASAGATASSNETASPHAGRVAGDGWRALAEAGEFERAYAQLRHAGPDALREEPRALLLAADVARLSGHPAEAVAPLQRVLARFADDPRATLAAFTLGRVYNEDLGRPREAALAFERARTSDPAGSLAEDALAREVEAWSRAGDATRARSRAQEYLAEYPSGRRARAVRRFGGLE